MIFNKNDNADIELKAVLGFLSADFKFKDLKSYVLTAEKDIAELISPGVLKQASEYYLSDAYKPDYSDGGNDKDKFVFHLQMALASKAYRYYADNNDLSHSGSAGRNINIVGDQRAAFKEQIDRSNEALDKTWATNTNLCMEIVVVWDSWANSEQFRLANQTFFPTLQALNDVYYIGNNYQLYRQLLPTIRNIERTYIMIRLGSELYKNLRADKTINEELYAQVQLAVANKSISESILSSSIEIKIGEREAQELNKMFSDSLERIETLVALHLNIKAEPPLPFNPNQKFCDI